MTLHIGKTIAFERTFRHEEVALFTQLSKDEGIHHLEPDEEGRLVVQGLLTATLPTKIGGEHNVLARQMNFEFIRPVFTGDTIRCEAIIKKLEKDERNRTQISAIFTCFNQEQKEVLRGSFAGVIL